MGLTYPTIEELAAHIRAEFRVQLPDVDPTVFGSWARAFADGNAALAQSISFLVRDLEKQLFPQTATGEFLELWGDYEGLERKPAAPAFGSVTLPGTVGTVVTTGTEFTGSNGIIYESTAVATITAVNQAVSTLTRSGTTATAVLAAEHQLATGVTVTMSGATQAEYNGDFVIVVTAADEFQYTITGAPATPATGSPVYDVDIASIEAKAQTEGSATNLDSGAQITGTPGTAFVQFDGLSGGASEETDTEYRARIMLSRSIIQGVFTPDQIKLAALSVAGNTRAFVKKPTLSVCPGGGDAPVPGQVGVFVLRDNDPSITPTAGVLSATKDAIVAEGALPANSSSVDLLVQAPTLVPTAFTFTSLAPDTPTMRTAVEDQLQAFFEDTVDFEADVTEASYLGAIQSTQDLLTGAFLTSFALSAPTAGITVADGEIATLGAVTFV